MKWEWEWLEQRRSTEGQLLAGQEGGAAHLPDYCQLDQRVVIQMVKQLWEKVRKAMHPSTLLRLDQAASSKRNRPLDIHLQLEAAGERSHWPSHPKNPKNIMRHPRRMRNTPKGGAYNATWRWKHGSPGAGEIQRSMGRIRFVVSRKWPLWIIFRQFYSSICFYSG